MKDALENATDADRAAINEMLGDLNELLDKHRRGEDTQEDFDDFMAKHGDFFPENPQNIDELLDAMAQRAAAAQRMLNSMTPEQRQELMELSAQAFGSPAADGVARPARRQPAGRCAPARTGAARSGSTASRVSGLGDGTGVFQDLADLDALSEQLAQSYGGARMDDLDLDKLARQLGDEAAVDARTLQELEKALRDGGTLKRGSDGQLKLTPKAMRQLGKALLQRRRRSGCRVARASATWTRPAPPGSARARPASGQFGDTEPWDMPAHDPQRRQPPGRPTPPTGG